MVMAVLVPVKVHLAISGTMPVNESATKEIPCDSNVYGTGAFLVPVVDVGRK